MQLQKNILIILALAGAAPVAGCGDDAESAGSAGQAAGLAIVNGDYTSIAVSLLNPTTGALVKDNCVNSGTSAPKLSTALSGDVVLPSQPQPGNELVLIDRKNGTLTWVEPATCTVTRQVNAGTGFASNPHDLIAVSSAKAYVTRYGAKAGGAEGSDLGIVDPSGPAVTGRIDLTPYLVKPDVLAAPDRGVMADGSVYVTLNNMSADFKIAGPGRIIVIDPSTNTVTGKIDLPTLKNCSGITYLASGKTLAVACGGFFGDGAGQVNGSGIAWIDLRTKPATVTVVAASKFGAAPGRPVSFADVGASSALGFTITAGDFTGTPPDQVWAFDTATGTPQKILDGGAEAFTLGGLLLDAANKHLFIADADSKMPKLYMLDITDPTKPVKTSIDASPATKLPPRSTGWY